MRRLACVLALLFPAIAMAQQTPKFDVIVVRPHDRSDVSTDGGIHWEALVFEAKNVPITFLMTQAFGVKKWLIEGVPQWAAKGTWDMNAKVTAGDLKMMQTLTREERSSMLQNVLIQQFGLRYHFESRVQPVYELHVQPGGAKFHTTSITDSEAAAGHTGNWNFSAGEVQCQRITMAQFANGLSPLVERVVLDRTGLPAAYDLQVRWTPDGDTSGNSNGSDADDAPGLATALREQAGLKLAAAKAPVPVLIVDSMTHPEAQ